MEDTFYLCDSKELSIKNTFDCGQCFRWEQSDQNEYIGVAMGAVARIFEKQGGIYIQTKLADEQLWRKYFDLDKDYSHITSEICTDDFMEQALAFGQGLRILNQQPWEALCSFIISQCNNIPRIKKIISNLSAMLGDKIEFCGKEFYTFPECDKIAKLKLGDLACLRAGYREEYIINASFAVASKTIDFENLSQMSTVQARKEIMKLKGVGNKVADCFLLFGLNRLDAFPIDTWMKKAAKFYDGASDQARFGQYAGIAQQYIFYYARENGIGNGG